MEPVDVVAADGSRSIHTPAERPVAMACAWAEANCVFTIRAASRTRAAAERRNDERNRSDRDDRQNRDHHQQFDQGEGGKPQAAGSGRSVQTASVCHFRCFILPAACFCACFLSLPRFNIVVRDVVDPPVGSVTVDSLSCNPTCRIVRWIDDVIRIGSMLSPCTVIALGVRTSWTSYLPSGPAEYIKRI